MRKYNYLALALAAVCSIGAAWTAWNTLDFMRSALVADGEVVETPIGPHHPRITFNDEAGNRVEFAANGDVSQTVGDRVRILYLRDDPRRSAKLETFGSLWGVPLFFAGMAILWLIGGLRNIPFRGWRGND
jgi:hypothetical protein